MGNNLAAIGFDFADPSDFKSCMLELAGDAIARIGCAAGDYAIWRSRSGVEIWFHLAPVDAGSDEREIVGLTPFFEGSSEIAMEITERLSRTDDNAFEGAFLATLGGGRPVVFDAIDFAVHADRPLPFRSAVKLVGFASRIASVIGAGARNGAIDCKDGSTHLRGTIGESRCLRNEATSRDFMWHSVQCEIGRIDVAARAKSLDDEVAHGSPVELTCHLFGRLLD